ncbi:DNA polymerase III subunit delta', partial [Streptomyces sp. NPDC054933]
MAVWDDLVGQEPVVAQLAAAARDADALVTAAAEGAEPPRAWAKLWDAGGVTGPPRDGRCTPA